MGKVRRNASKARTEPNRERQLLSCFRDTVDDLVFWSFRYFLGRMTIQTDSFTDDLARAWPHLNERVKGMIKKELEEAFERDDKDREKNQWRTLGHDCDREAWERVRRAYAPD